MNNKMRQSRLLFGVVALVLVAWSTLRFGVAPVEAARISDIRATKHNLSTSGTGSVKASGTQTTSPGVNTDEVCVFCHTPHGATQKDQGDSTLTRAPLWNKTVPAGTTYTPYTSSSLDAQSISDGFVNQPGGSSKLCLSCHDGSLAIGSVGVLGGKRNVTIDMLNAGTGGKMPGGSYTASSGFTRNLDVDLSNDHPISVTYNSTLVSNDGELRAIDASQRVSAKANSLPTGKTHAVGIPDASTRPLLPLQKTSTGGAGQVQCSTCHDPHIKDTTVDHNIKFLRANRFQVSAPGAAGYDATNDIICLACHDKGGPSDGTGTAWADSVHANSTTGAAVYKNASGSPNPNAVRDFPLRNTFKVWEAACLNCHDTHTIPGARRLLREGTNGTGNPKTGGSSAIEETCFQCHRKYTDTDMVLSLASQTVPDIRTDFAQGDTATGTPATYHMPLRSNEQCAGSEKHDIGDSTLGSRAKKGKDFYETPTNLGGGAGTCDANSKRHVECTDCHNPHRAIKNSLADGSGSSGQATHTHNTSATVGGVGHSNAASGALKGSFGVDITSWESTAFGAIPSGFSERCGVTGGNNACAAQVDKEYQICLKCHSNYSYGDVTATDANRATAYNYSGRPPLIDSGTANRYTTKAPYNQWASGDRYTNQGMEFQPAGTGEPGLGNKATCFDQALDTTCNHRSWHPVMGSTGRGGATRGYKDGANTDISSNWIAPFNAQVGSQTMYCTDCHGNSTTGNTVVPDSGKPWGPHGSTNPFILKGTWGKGTGSSTNDNALCFKCHDKSAYVKTDNSKPTGFWIADTRNGCQKNNDGHKVHNTSGSTSGNIRCNWCHVAVPHGWKNKALLVNLNDVGPEAGQPAGTEVNGPYNKAPYYRNAMLKIYNFAPSGYWDEMDCGKRNGSRGRDNYMRQSNSSGGCSSPPTN